MIEGARAYSIYILRAHNERRRRHGKGGAVLIVFDILLDIFCTWGVRPIMHTNRYTYRYVARWH